MDIDDVLTELEWNKFRYSTAAKAAEVIRGLQKENVALRNTVDFMRAQLKAEIECNEKQT